MEKLKLKSLTRLDYSLTQLGDWWKLKLRAAQNYGLAYENSTLSAVSTTFYIIIDMSTSIAEKTIAQELNFMELWHLQKPQN